MRILNLNRLLVFLLVTTCCGAARSQTCNPDSISIREYGRYKADQSIIIVPAKLSRECLSAPRDRIEFFDADGRDLTLYLECQKRGERAGAEFCNAYSLKWIEKHTVGFLQPTDDDDKTARCFVWGVIDKDHRLIQKFERVSWCPYAK